MTHEEYFKKCEEVNAKIREILPDADGWRWVLCVRNQVIDRWATGTNLVNSHVVQLLEAAIRVRKFEQN